MAHSSESLRGADLPAHRPRTRSAEKIRGVRVEAVGDANPAYVDPGGRA